MDEMAIKKHVEWDGQQYRGFVNVGTDTDVFDDTTPVAKDVLVLMAVALNDNWKVPCGYFLIEGLTGLERANLVTVCLKRLHDTGVKVVSLTCDGPSCNFSMMRELGAKLDPTQPDFSPWFNHSSDPACRIQVMMDVCHMIKLVRNCLGDMGLLVDSTGQPIQWAHIAALHQLQESEGLRLGNKLKSSHIEWRKQKMKVNLAAQTLSTSVADALEYCGTKLKLRPFLACEGLVNFIRMFDNLFDILNSRNPFAKGTKSPVVSS